MRAFALVAILLSSAPAYGQGPPVPDAPTPAAPKPPEPTPAEKKMKYSLPFAMRPAIAPKLARIDQTLAVIDGGSTNVTMLTGGATFMKDLGVYGRAAVVSHAPAGAGATVLSNPIVFGLWTPEIAPKIRLPIFAGVTAPIGMGGGSNPDPAERTAVLSGIYARQAMDNALFVTNYMTPTVGAGISYVDRGFTAQFETTVLQLMRTRGDALDKDESRTNWTSGLSVGYLAFGLINFSAEMHYQRWLSSPAAVKANDALRDQWTVGGGARFNIALSKSAVMRPGIAYFHPLDAPMTTASYRIVMLDVPVAF